MRNMAQHAKRPVSSGGDDAAEDLIYHITHDLRAPIRALTILPDWIEEDLAESGLQIPASITEHLETIREQTGALDRMILDLRDYSRIGRLADPVRDVAFRSVIEDVLRDLQSDRELSLQMRLDVETIRAPANDLKTLFRTLITNCVHHHDRSMANVLVETRLAGSELLISVVDDGPGIHPDHRERAFELMTTLYRRDEGAGSGIGLAIARRVVQNLHGRIEIADAPGGRGTNVQIAIPLPRSTQQSHSNEISRFTR